jgi:superfamily II DNA or RNA helicase
MELRNQIQQQATQKIHLHNFRGIINVAPRVGKSKIVCDAIKIFKVPQTILITVPYNSIQESWTTELNKWGVNIPIAIINQRSLAKESDLNMYDIIICDEIHTLSNAQIQVLQNFDGPILGVSGSISKETEKQLRQELGLKTIFKYTLEEAVKDGIVANYEINLVPVTLDNKDKYIDAGNKTTTFKTTEYLNYQYLTEQFNKFKRAAWNNPKMNAVKMQYASKRANLIYNSKTKLEAVSKIIAKFDRCLIFTARTEIADQLGSGYHSKSTPEVLESFMSGETNKLAVCEMTNMGITFPNLKVGIFHQMKSSEESAIQKVMRMCNMEDDAIAQIFITYYANTVDEEWIKKALEGLDPDKIKILSL